MLLKLILGTFLSSIFSAICGCLVSKTNLTFKKKGSDIHYCQRIPSSTIRDEVKLFEKFKNEEAGNEKLISYRLFRQRASHYNNLMKLARKNQPRVDPKSGKNIKTFTTLPSYNYKLHPDLRDLFLDE